MEPIATKGRKRKKQDKKRKKRKRRKRQDGMNEVNIAVAALDAALKPWLPGSTLFSSPTAPVMDAAICADGDQSEETNV
jgi:hypothetical protein